jgi:hypothetical protein
MPNGYSVFVALSDTDASAYPGWHPTFPFGAADLADVSGLYGAFNNIATLSGSSATADKILGAVSDASRAMAEGDTLVFSYAGHGGYIPDAQGRWDPAFSFKALATYDRLLLGSELGAVWQRFPPGRNVVMIVDCCFCGALFSKRAKFEGVTGAPLPAGITPEEIKKKLPGGTNVGDKGIVSIRESVLMQLGLTDEQQAYVDPMDAPIAIPSPTDECMKPEYARLQDKYDSIRDATAFATDAARPIPIIGLLACSGDEEAGSSGDESVFSRKLRIVATHELQPTYSKYAARTRLRVIQAYLDTDKYPQVPQFVTRGPKDDVAALAQSKPFEA